jgi:hypothetical protein
MKETSALVNPNLCGANSKCFGSDSSMYCDIARIGVSSPAGKEHTSSRSHLLYFYGYGNVLYWRGYVSVYQVRFTLSSRCVILIWIR